MNRCKTTPYLAAICVTAFAFTTARAQEDPISVVVFYANDEPHWRNSEKLIDTVVAQHPRLRLTKVNIDDPVGYKQLHAFEESAHLTEHGELTVLVRNFPLISVGEKNDVERYFTAVAERMLGLSDHKGRKLADAAAYAKDIFGPDAAVTAANGKPGAEIEYYRVQSGGKNAGWVVDAYHPVNCPICADSQFLLAVKSPELVALDMRPVRELEVSGVKVEPKAVADFTRQFKDRGPAQAQTRVDGISGATKTSAAYQEVFEQVMSELKTRENK